MLHEWFRVVLETSVQLALMILPAAPLLGRKLPSIDVSRSGLNTGAVERAAQVSASRPEPPASRPHWLVQTKTSAGWPKSDWQR
jgi:hypothetical protein